jgi:hypothetical protein
MNKQRGSIALILVAIIALLAIGGGAYYEIQQKAASQQTQAPTQTQPTQQTSTATDVPLPTSDASVTILSVTPSFAAVGSTITIKGSHFDPLERYAGNEWISNTHTNVYIKNGKGQTQVLWSGNEPDKPATKVIDTIQVSIPSGMPCVGDSGSGGCWPGAYEIIPGNYQIYVTVDGRGADGRIGTSNSVPLTISAAQTSAISVSGMSKYTDPDFGFSFWYPSTWTITQSGATHDENNDASISGYTIQKTLHLEPPDDVPPEYANRDGITISEVSTAGSLAFASSTKVMGGITYSTVRYYFDSSKREWMEEFPFGNESNFIENVPIKPGFTVPADTSHATMSGLPIFDNGLTLKAYHVLISTPDIIPLNSHHVIFISSFVNDVGPTYNGALESTVVATDPSVASSVSTDNQIKTIQAERGSYEGK